MTSETGRSARRPAWSAVVRVCMLLATLGAVVPGLTEAQTVVKIWDHHVHDKKYKKDAFKAFNAQNPDVRIEYTSQISASYIPILNAAIVSGSPPDVFIAMGEANLPKLIEKGWVTPIDDLAPSKEELSKWIASFPEGQQPFVEGLNVFKGKVYSWPIQNLTGWMMLFYNTDLFVQAGLKDPTGKAAEPQTWDDMRTFAKKITEVGQGKVYGIVHGIKSEDIWEQDIGQSLAVLAGWPFRGFDSRTGRWDFHSHSLRGPIQLWLDMKKDGSVFPGDLSMDDEQAKFKFAQNLAGMMFSGYWAPGGYLAVNPDLQFDTVMPPVEVRGKQLGYLPMGPLAGMSEYVVSNKIKDKAAIWKVIQFLTSAEYQEGWVKAGGGVSVFPQYNKPDLFPHPTVAKIAAMGQVRPAYPPSPPGADKVGELVEYIRPDYVDLIQGMWIGQAGWNDFDELERKQNEAFDKALVEARKSGVNLTRADFTFPDWDPAKGLTSKSKK